MPSVLGHSFLEEHRRTSEGKPWFSYNPISWHNSGLFWLKTYFLDLISEEPAQQSKAIFILESRDKTTGPQQAEDLNRYRTDLGEGEGQVYFASRGQESRQASQWSAEKQPGVGYL